MTTLYKATNTAGRDFYSDTVQYRVGQSVPVKPEVEEYYCCSATVYHASDTPAETLLGGSWPCRLFEVTGEPVASQGHKFGFRTLTVVREIEGWKALGPNGEQVVAFLESLRSPDLTARNAAWNAAWNAARNAAWNAAWNAARNAAWNAAGEAAWYAAARKAVRYAVARKAVRYAAGALVVRDLISDDHFRTLTSGFADLIA